MSAREPIRVLVPLNTVVFYGMERSVVSLFDHLRPEIDPCFLVPQGARRAGGVLLDELHSRGLAIYLMSDDRDWPKISWPSSIKQGGRILTAVVRGNKDTLQAAQDVDAIYLPSLRHLHHVGAAIRQRLRGGRVILRFHEVPSESSLRLRLSRHWVTDYVHASEWGKRQAESLEPAIQRRRSHVLPNLVRAPTEPRPEVMEESPKRILFLGRIVPDKGVDILIQAFSDLLEDVPDVQLDLVGGCSDSEYEQEIQEAIERHGLEHRVTRHGFQRDTARYFERAAVVAIPTPPSRCREAFGRVAVEAMASGVPAVSFDSGALRDHVLDEETGILCKEESPEALSRALARLLTDRKFRDACARTAAERYQERYGEHAVRQQWLRLFSENEASGCGGGAERRP